jgi:hypothetical protein
MKIRTKLFLLVFVFTLLYGCSNNGINNTSDTSDIIQSETSTTAGDTVQITEDPSSGQETGIDNGKALKVLKDFLASETKHIKGSYSSIYYTGQTDGPTVFEMWIKGNRIRLDEYRGGKLYRTLYSLDGAAKNYMYGSGNTIDSIMPLAYYTSLFSQDISAAEDPGYDESGDTAVYKFTVDAFYKLDAAQSGYYVTEIEYHVTNSAVTSHIVYGRDSTGEKPEQLNIVTQTLDLVEIGIELQDTIFEPPF